MREIPSGSIDMVLTDPPFSSGGREATKGVRKSMTRETGAEDWFGSDNLSVHGFGHLMRRCALEWYRVCKPGAHLFVFIDWRMLPHLSAAIESADLVYRGVLVWDKTYFGMGSHFRNQHEFILHFSKDKPRKPMRRDVPNVLQCKPIRGGDHPTEKPVDLLRRLMEVVIAPGDTVLDCFNGSGATGVAAVQFGANYLGIEREPKYVTMSERRLEAAYWGDL